MVMLDRFMKVPSGPWRSERKLERLMEWYFTSQRAFLMLKPTDIHVGSTDLVVTTSL